MKAISVGIDNGISGAIVALDHNYKVVAYQDTPVVVLTKVKRRKAATDDEPTVESPIKKKRKKVNVSDYVPATMVEVLKNIIYEVTGLQEVELKVWLEVAQAMPQQGLSSTFKIGRGFGLWEGIVAALGLQYDIVHPATWTKIMLRDIPAGEPKQRTMIKAQRLFGSSLPLTKPHGRTLSLDGRADAALIAYYGMMQMRGNPPKDPAPARTPVKKKVT